MKTVEVLTKKGCHLCDLLLGELDILQTTHNFVVKLTHIGDDPEKMREYGNDIPVVLVDGREVCRHALDRGALLAVLAAHESKGR